MVDLKDSLQLYDYLNQQPLLLNNPSLIIADEPTGNLDPETSDDILLLLRDLAQKQNTAVLFATHDYRILENFPARIIRCHQEKVIDEEDIIV